MVRIKVPGTTANLGPAFDTAGMAFEIYNYFDFYESDEPKNFEEDNLIYISAKKVYDYLGKDISSMNFKVEGEVPQSRGLGSSATCIVGGIVGANLLLGNLLSQQEILNLATELEGHPDNVAPALLGGCVFSTMDGENVLYQRIEGMENLTCFLAIPDFPLETRLAREALPDSLTYKETVSNISQIAFLINGLRESNLDDFLVGTKDNIHEPYRKELIHGFDQMKKIEEEYKGRMLISGAGPTLLFVTDGQVDQEELIKKWEEIAEKTGEKWKILSAPIDHEGTKEI
ncbi:homoserine kinase [Peptoniphilus sp. KCTC 25270]|uniref:homoserine kinase n=1 Tax=Peptoniphilus sp. KCTC 25270 TaxID=2897414 RepID=UPI001E2C61F7|nr:homoserine kinase [Peptoniphilus sp. KCTC 25270]MCD1146841.1 homoserine kinase [Peptoniphilus sp. KCTC 25270]